MTESVSYAHPRTLDAMTLWQDDVARIRIIQAKTQNQNPGNIINLPEPRLADEAAHVPCLL